MVGEKKTPDTEILVPIAGKKKPQIFGGFFFRHLEIIVFSEYETVHLFAGKEAPQRFGGGFFFRQNRVWGGFFPTALYSSETV